MLALLPLGYNLAERFTRLIEGPFVDGAVYWGYLMPVIGIASVVQLYWQQHVKRVLVLAAVLVVLILWLTPVTPRLGRWDLFKVVLRLLFMQALLHRRGMQNMSLAGALDIVAGGGAGGDKTLIRRHLSFFNCNPNFVPLIAGGILRLEEEKKRRQAHNRR